MTLLLVLISPLLLFLTLRMGSGLVQCRELEARKMDNSRRIANITAAIKDMLEDYDIRLRPRFGGPAIDIGIDIEIVSINSISEVNMDYTLTMYFRQHWKDERLSYDPCLGNVSLSGILAERIWVPDTYFPNDKRSFVHDVTVTNKLLRFHHDGTITYGMRITSVASCYMDLVHYPMDEQNCSLEIESYGYTTADVNFVWQYGDDSLEGVNNIEMAQFTLSDYKLIVKMQNFSTGSYPRLALTFRIKRNVGFFFLQTYLPSILLVMLSWVSFWINHEATSARVSLGITTVLTMTTISTAVRQSLPRISYVKSIDIYVITCYSFVFAALVEYAIVNYNYWLEQKKKVKEAHGIKNNPTQNSNNKKPPEVRYDQLQQFNPQVALRLSQVDSEDDILEDDEMKNSMGMDALNGNDRGHRRTSLTYRPQHRTNAQNNARNNTAYGPRYTNVNPSITRRRKKKPKRIRVLPRIRNVNTVDRVSRILFPFLFLLFNVLYWVGYLYVLPNRSKNE
ncbi:gamma-aminobutyric acid receptor subunit beta-2-like [Strongylocentrotus purpuratus]|uniref:Gamma-aminobutyric acid receptor subunit beta n=1 Tax=Strongylocentrotus purpuratus TaxID=7668 RepID=A0A7M7NID7_STRPU|nr:gamma-aminobutyric acid receptor subunit beta-2-like [Strongylocentrotus purpuratus]